MFGYLKADRIAKPGQQTLCTKCFIITFSAKKYLKNKRLQASEQVSCPDHVVETLVERRCLPYASTKAEQEMQLE